MSLGALALALALTSSLAFVRVSGQSINSPASLEVCAPQQILVNGGTPPYSIAALPGGATGGQVLSRISTDAQEGAVTWTVDVPAGQNVTLAVRDSTGATGYSSQIPVLAGVSDSCLAADPSSSSLGPEESGALSPASSSSASFDEASVSSLIDSLTRFTPPPVETTTLPASSPPVTTLRVDSTGATPIDTPLAPPTLRTTLGATSPTLDTATATATAAVESGQSTPATSGAGPSLALFASPFSLSL